MNGRYISNTGVRPFLFGREAARRPPLAMICVLLTTACARGSAPAAGLSADEVAAIKRAQQKYEQAVLAGDWAGVSAVHTADAIRMPPNAADVRGRAAIGTDMAAAGKAGAVNP